MSKEKLFKTSRKSLELLLIGKSGSLEAKYLKNDHKHSSIWSHRKAVGTLHVHEHQSG